MRSLKRFLLHFCFNFIHSKLSHKNVSIDLQISGGVSRLSSLQNRWDTNSQGRNRIPIADLCFPLQYLSQHGEENEFLILSACWIWDICFLSVSACKFYKETKDLLVFGNFSSNQKLCVNFIFPYHPVQHLFRIMSHWYAHLFLHLIWQRYEDSMFCRLWYRHSLRKITDTLSVNFNGIKIMKISQFALKYWCLLVYMHKLWFSRRRFKLVA